MNAWVARDVVRLIFRYVGGPYEARGLLWTNRFWRAALVSEYEAVSRPWLWVWNRVPKDHTIAVIKWQVQNASPTTVVVLHVLWTCMERLVPELARVHGLYKAVADPLAKAETKMRQRTFEVTHKQWGLGRKASTSTQTLSSEDWTKKMQKQATKKYEKLRDANDVEPLRVQWMRMQRQHDALALTIAKYYEANGDIGSLKPPPNLHGGDLAFLAEYPHERGEVKKRICDTEQAHQRALEEERALSAKYSRVRYALANKEIN